MSRQPLNAIDRSFLLLESRRSMMHVAGLMLFRRPEHAPKDLLRQAAQDLRAATDIQAPWHCRLSSPAFLGNPRQAWVADTNIDLDYHVRRSALPQPGDERELGVLVSRLHSHPIDFHRPPWELHLIEGLADQRFALYFKIHHALVDGFSAARMLVRGLADEPDASATPPLFCVPRSTDATGQRPPILHAALAQAKAQIQATKHIGRAIRTLAHAARASDSELAVPMQAPASILNRRIGRNRRFATQQFPLARIKRLAQAADATINDIVLALTAAGLRRFLLELGELPAAPLVAMIPVNVRPADDPGGGNAIGVMLASLATDIADPQARLAVILASARRAKSVLRGMSRSAIIQYSALLMVPLAAQVLTGTSGRVRPPFNLVISNVPGPTQPLYFRGARMQAGYPVSICLHGQALNISCQSYLDTLCFGFVGCRDTLPHMQRLAVYTGAALTELEAALGI